MSEHHPPVISQRRMVEQVWLDNPVHLQVFKVVGNALVESLANVGVVLLGSRFAIVYRVAALRSTAVCNARPDVLVIRIRDRELVVEVMIEAEEPGPHVDLVVVVRVSAEPVHTDRLAIQGRDVRNHCGRERTPEGIARRNNVGLSSDRSTRDGVKAITIPDWLATYQSRGRGVEDFPYVNRPTQGIENRVLVRVG